MPGEYTPMNGNLSFLSLSFLSTSQFSAFHQNIHSVHDIHTDLTTLPNRAYFALFLAYFWQFPAFSLKWNKKPITIRCYGKEGERAKSSKKGVRVVVVEKLNFQIENHE